MFTEVVILVPPDRRKTSPWFPLAVILLPHPLPTCTRSELWPCCWKLLLGHRTHPPDATSGCCLGLRTPCPETPDKLPVYFNKSVCFFWIQSGPAGWFYFFWNGDPPKPRSETREMNFRQLYSFSPIPFVFPYTAACTNSIDNWCLLKLLFSNLSASGRVLMRYKSILKGHRALNGCHQNWQSSWLSNSLNNVKKCKKKLGRRDIHALHGCNPSVQQVFIKVQ